MKDGKDRVKVWGWIWTVPIWLPSLCSLWKRRKTFLVHLEKATLHSKMQNLQSFNMNVICLNPCLPNYCSHHSRAPLNTYEFQRSCCSVAVKILLFLSLSPLSSILASCCVHSLPPARGAVPLWMPPYRFSGRSQTPPAPRGPAGPPAPAAAAGSQAGQTMIAMPLGALGTASTTTPASPPPFPSSSLLSTWWSSSLAWWGTPWWCLSL